MLQINQHIESTSPFTSRNVVSSGFPVFYCISSFHFCSVRLIAILVNNAFKTVQQSSKYYDTKKAWAKYSRPCYHSKHIF